jgi:hypothetical protein
MIKFYFQKQKSNQTNHISCQTTFRRFPAFFQKVTVAVTAEEDTSALPPVKGRHDGEIHRTQIAVWQITEQTLSLMSTRILATA